MLACNPNPWLALAVRLSAACVFVALPALAQGPTVTAPERAAAAAKPVLAVLKFQDETGAMPFQGGVGRVLSNMLGAELAAREAFTVVERRRLNAIIEEQNLALSGRIAPGDSAKIGQLTGAQYLVMGTVTAYEPDTETKVQGGLLGRGHVEQVNHGAYLAVDLRVVNTSSGEVSYARSVEGRTTDRALKIDLAAPNAGYQMLRNQSDSKAVRGAVIEIIEYLECVMVRRDGCESAYQSQDERRREGTRKAFNSDGKRQ